MGEGKVESQRERVRGSKRGQVKGRDRLGVKFCPVTREQLCQKGNLSLKKRPRSLVQKKWTGRLLTKDPRGS